MTFDMDKLKDPEKVTALDLYHSVLSGVFYLGNFPLTFNLKLKRYELKFFSLKFLYTLILHLIIYTYLLGLLASVYLGNVWFIPIEFTMRSHCRQELLSKNGTNIGSVMGISLDYVCPILTALNMILLTTCCKDMAAFAVGWETFEVNFKELFGRKPFISLRKLRNKTCLGYLVVGWTPLLLLVLLQFQSLENGWTLESTYKLLLLLIMQLSTLGVIVRDAYTIFMCLTIAVAFREVKLALKSIPKAKPWPSDGINEQDEVEKWTGLICTIRAQVKQLERTLGTMGIYELFALGYFLLSTLFLFYNSFTGIEAKPNTEKGVIFTILWMSFWSMARKIVMVNFVEKITQEEKDLANTILVESSDKYYDRVGVEMKVFVIYLTESPSKLKLGNLIIFDKGLLLRIIGHVVTYLIVLIQFDTNSRT